MYLMKIDTPVRVIKDTYFHTPIGSEGVIVYIYPPGKFGEGPGLLYSVIIEDKDRVLFREHELEEINGD